MSDPQAVAERPVPAIRRQQGGEPRLALERSLFVLMGFIISLIVGLIAAHLVAVRSDVLDRAEKNAANLGQAFEEHLAISIGLLNDTLLAMRSQSFIRDSEQLRAGLRSRPGLNDIALQVAVADREGRIVATNFELNEPVSIADRPHFRHFQDHTADDLFISAPVLGRVSQHWAIQFVRRLNDSGGRFDGVVVISLEPDFLIRFYRAIDAGPAGLVGLIGMDGVVRAQEVGGTSSFGQSLGDRRLIEAASAMDEGSIRTSALDGIKRLVAFKKVRGYPLFVAVGLAEDDVLVDFDHEVWLWCAVAAVGSLFVIVAGTAALRRIRAQRVYEAELRRAEEAVSALKTRYELILRSAGDGIIGVDARETVRFVNPAARRMLALSGEMDEGGTYRKLLCGPGDHGLLPDFPLTEEPGRILESQFVRDDGNRFTAEYVLAPIHEDGKFQGAVLVFRDISLRKAYEESLADRQRDLERQVAERTQTLSDEIERRSRSEQALRDNQNLLTGITSNLFESVLLVDCEGLIVFANRAAHELLGASEAELEGRGIDEVMGVVRGATVLDFAASPFHRAIESERTVIDDDAVLVLGSGRRLRVAFASAPLREDGRRDAAIISFRSIEALKAAQLQALQASKLASVGQLASGIAHEINTPVQYIGDNLRFIKSSFGKLLNPIDQVAVPVPQTAQDLAFLREEVPAAIDESLLGVAQIAHIVLSMREFSHPGTDSKTICDINKALDSALTVSRNVWKHVATIERDLDPALPRILCHANELNQVLLNLIVNAAQAIEMSGKECPGRISIATRSDGAKVTIRVADTGTGVPEALRDRIFDPFFTTKQVGQGTGQGLAICHDVVVTKHGGTIEVGGEEGEGAVFTVRLPAGGSEDEPGC